MSVFGKEEAQEMVVATIHGKGLLSEIACVKNIAEPLMTDLDITQHPGMLLSGRHGSNRLLR
jgi:hypothetical protein